MGNSLSKLINYTKELLGESDKFQGSFRGTLGHTFGHLVLSNTRVLFLREGGMGGAEFESRFDIPYSDLGYEALERNLLKLTDGSGTVHTMQTSMMAKFVCMKLDQLSK